MQAVLKRTLLTTLATLLMMVVAMIAGLIFGSAGTGWRAVGQTFQGLLDPEHLYHQIVWQLRMPRVIMAAMVGATLSLGGLVFQALLRNPLAEPYILGISGGAAIGAIIGILLGLSHFPGISVLSFSGGMATLILVLVIASGPTLLKKETLLLSGVMVNAFCSAVIMFLISLTTDARVHNILFWLMGDLSAGGKAEALQLSLMVIPFFIVVFWLSNAMNLLMMGKETAYSMGVNVKLLTVVLLVITSFMVSVTVSHCGLVAFVGLVIPHLFRLALGPDHRVLVPACIFGGGAYLVICDLLARTLPRTGEMPVGVITAMIGAPVFILLLKRSSR
jgi:iron complex transport system permease protein